jgi:bifunctional non-homologous end joining protein LigD
VSLADYRRKRDFGRTPEPAGKAGTGGKRDKKGTGQFVIQKHDATQLHYDFRLELDGVLKSWAIPKGPSLDPKERRLAVEVEDHPLDYGAFEGVIPEGEYGGGTVLLWDRGRWQPEGDPRQGLRKGHLKFRLEGEKLHGGWALVRMRRREDEKKDNWLLIKEADEEARPLRRGDVLKQRPESVDSGRSLGEIADTAAERGEVWSAGGAAAKPGKLARAGKKTPPKKRAAKRTRAASSNRLPPFVAPQLATLAAEVPKGDDWLFELKLDGYRIEAAVAGGHAKLLTRNAKDWTAKFPVVAAAVAKLPVASALLDGEVVALAADGRSSFQALQNALRPEAGAERTALVYFVFDLLHLDGDDLTGRPLAERKDLLHRLLGRGTGATARYNDHIAEEGAAFYRQACRLGVEGVVAKRASAPYRPGRGTDWLKVKCIQRQELVIGGFTAPKGTRSDLGALLLGVYDGDELRFAGKVGTGFDAASLRDLRRRLQPLARKRPPFAAPPRGADARGVQWVEPKLVAEVAFTEWTADGHLRHPSFQGLREDKPARQVRRERPAPPPKAKKSKKSATPRKEEATDTVAGIHLTHPDRVLYPEQGVTKLDLARYYEAAADWILPHLAGRPLSLVRCPQGSGKACFYQKHLREGAPDAVRAVTIAEEDGGKEPYPYVNDLAGIVALVQIGVLELHGWGAKIANLEHPDRLVFDLDPDPSVGWERVAEAALLLRERLAELRLESFVQTTGGKGLHVFVPLSPRRSWDEVKAFARALAESVVAAAPDRYLSKASKAARKGKIFIDWLRNGRGATAIVPYSTRARAGATVATPLDWKELDRTQPLDLSVKTVPARLAALRADPWEGFWKLRQSLRADVLRKLKVE